MFWPDRHLSYSLASRVVNRIGNCSRRSGNSNFPDSASADRIEFEIGTIEKLDFDGGNVGVGRHQILGKISIRDPAASSVVTGLFQKRHSDAKHDAANDLAARSLLAYDKSDSPEPRRSNHEPSPHRIAHQKSRMRTSSRPLRWPQPSRSLRSRFGPTPQAAGRKTAICRCREFGRPHRRVPPA